MMSIAGVITALEVTLLAYLIGSVPFGILFTRLGSARDPRRGGSGNIGATNVWRVAGKTAAIGTLIGDMGKGFIAVYGAGLMFGDVMFPSVMFPSVTFWGVTFWGVTFWGVTFGGVNVAAIAVLIGHMFPCWLAGRGGKGVATAFGVLFAFDGVLGLICVALWCGVFILWRISSLAALVMITVAPFLAWWEWAPDQWGTVALMALLIGWRHIPNVRRLAHGEEASLKRGDLKRGDLKREKRQSSRSQSSGSQSSAHKSARAKSSTGKDGSSS